MSDALKAQVLDKLRDALAEAENDNFEAAAMWASLAAEQWTDNTPSQAGKQALEDSK